MKPVFSSQEAAIKAALERGWQAAGFTRLQSVRTATNKNPIFGGIGGQKTFFGGRPKFLKPNSSWRITIGKRTTCIYQTGTGVISMINIPTKNLCEILHALDRIAFGDFI